MSNRIAALALETYNRRSSVIVGGVAALGLALSLATLGFKAPGNRTGGRARRAAGWFYPQSVRQLGGKSFQGKPTVLGLRAFVTCTGSHDGAEPFHEPGSLPWTKRGGGKVQTNLDASLGTIGMLATGPPAGGGSHLDLIERDGKRSTHAQHAMVYHSHRQAG